MVKKGDQGEMEEHKGKYIGRLILTAAAAFLMGRYDVANTYLPCGTAFMVAMLYKDIINLYYLPAVLIGMISVPGANVPDIIIAITISAFLTVLRRKRLSEWAGAVIISAISLTVYVAYAYLNATMYRVEPALLLGSIAFCIFIYYAFIYAGKGLREAIICAAATAVCSIGYMPVFMPGVFFITTATGYNKGIKDGITAGAICSLAVTATASAGLSVCAVLVTAGLVSGVFCRTKKIAAAVTVPAAVGLLIWAAGYDFDRWLFLGAVISSFVFLLIPVSFYERTEGRLIKQETSYSLKELKRKEELFRDMAAERRCSFSHVFEGMSQVLEKTCSMSSEQKRNGARYRVKSAVYGRGDCIRVKKLDDGRTLVVIADGMGRGAAAAEESHFIADTVEKLICAGFEAETAMRTVNAIIMEKGDRFPAADVCVLEKRGTAGIYKAGAPVTFIRRGDKVWSAQAQAPPFGALAEAEIGYEGIRMRPGDDVILLSDGVICADRKDLAGEWIRETICEAGSKDPQTISDLLIRRAVEKYGVREKDDMTVIVIRRES